MKSVLLHDVKILNTAVTVYNVVKLWPIGWGEYSWLPKLDANIKTDGVVSTSSSYYQ